jgi:hypothetical protein
MLGSGAVEDVLASLMARIINQDKRINLT